MTDEKIHSSKATRKIYGKVIPVDEENYLLFCYECKKNTVVCHPTLVAGVSWAVMPEKCVDCKVKGAFNDD